MVTLICLSLELPQPAHPRLLLEIMLGETFKYKDASVWNASGNYYYADGKKIKFPVSQTKNLDVKEIQRQLVELESENPYVLWYPQKRIQFKK